jgi:predicted short-subunit dehydrogenase-like oxidoreductase (DUF2520 family)
MKIVIIGAGNVATHLAIALKAAKLTLSQIWSNHYQNAVDLAERVGAVPMRTLNEIDLKADICLVAVKDDFVTEVIDQLTAFEGTIAHTAGAVDLTVFKGKFDKYGVFYPLQTFSKAKAVSFNTIPICIEANHKETLAQLQALGNELSNTVIEINTDQRKILHLSAVFACNFTNHLYALAAEILSVNGIDFELIRPLIAATAEKVQSALPAAVQTGPAVRADEATLKKHAELLQTQPQLLNIYKILSESIKKMR